MVGVVVHVVLLALRVNLILEDKIFLYLLLNIFFWMDQKIFFLGHDPPQATLGYIPDTEPVSKTHYQRTRTSLYIYSFGIQY